MALCNQTEKDFDLVTSIDCTTNMLHSRLSNLRGNFVVIVFQPLLHQI